MTYRISLLDKSPIAPGGTGAEAVATTLAYARLADELGYHRFWLAEHHGALGLASAAPEVLISHILAQTRHVRVGSGGVLLQHYGAYKVAEVFSVLATLAPGRVDLGIGQSPGGLPTATRAIQAELAPGSARDLDRKLAELEAWLQGPHREADIQPRPAILPERFLLGGSTASAERARRLSWGFVHAGHQDGDVANTRAAFSAHDGHQILAVAAFAAPTKAEARERLADLAFVRITFGDGHSVNLPTVEAAQEYARQYGSDDFRIDHKRPTVIAGTGEDIHAALTELSRSLGVSEFIIDQPVPEADARLRSIELIAQTALRAAA